MKGLFANRKLDFRADVYLNTNSNSYFSCYLQLYDATFLPEEALKKKKKTVFQGVNKQYYIWLTAAFGK